MQATIHRLYTAIEAEDLLGKKYFYRQRIYRLAANNKLVEFDRNGTAVYMAAHIIQAALKELELRIQDKFPQIELTSLRIFYDTVTGKRVIIDGLFGKGISVNTDEESEEDLLKKFTTIIEWIGNDNRLSIQTVSTPGEKDVDKLGSIENQESDRIVEVLPEEILWIRLDTGIIEGIEIKSYILVSLPSIAQFVGIRTDKLIEWIARTSFCDLILSAHHKQIQGTGKPGAWKRGVINGYISFIPFELLPEIIVALRQSRNIPTYTEKAQLLYDLAKTTLEAVGLAVSGNKDKAAEELARVGHGLGLTAADQIIGLFKQYESREFQVKTTKEFQSTVKELKLDYAATIGALTFGVTGRYPSHWKLLGTMKKLPKSVTDSSREVMRTIEPSASVGMAFGEKHFIKDHDTVEAGATGKQGKFFYERLKKVGLLA